MSTLQTLKLVATVKPQHLPDVVKRRYKLTHKLWEQIALAKSQASGEPLNITRQKTVKNMDTGISHTVAVAKTVGPWWFNGENGSLCVSVRYGSKLIELAKGKPTIELANKQELISTLELLKDAVEAGELDQQIEQVSGALRSNFKK
jgi:hypothetical protein